MLKETKAFGSGLLFALLWVSAPAQAQLRYIASTGNDARPCGNAAAPCRSLARAFATTPAGGEVRVLDSGSYGIGAVTQSITVSGDGVSIFGQIRVIGDNAVVALRSLNLDGRGTIQFGIYVTASATVHVEHCTVENYARHGVYIAAPSAHVFISDSISRDNGVAGLSLYDAAATAADHGGTTLSVDNSRIENNGADGALIIGGTSTFNRSIVSGNRANGINLNYGAAIIASTAATNNEAGAGYAFNQSKGTLDTSTAQSNEYGVVAGAGSATSVTLSNSTITNNRSKGIIANGAVMTRGNNTVVDNGVDVEGTLTPLAGQ